MRPEAPFQQDDLAVLARLFAAADKVVTMLDVRMGVDEPTVIALRHDVDDNHGSLDTALAFAEWEADRGIRASYYLLHDSHYWSRAGVAATQLEHMGHEVGLHLNAIAEGIRQDRDPLVILSDALAYLRAHVTVVGTVAHGDPLCHVHRFVNDELWIECARAAYGPPTRSVAHRNITPVSLSDYGLAYDANRLARGDYLSDSGGSWSQSFSAVATRFPSGGQLHMLVHPDWWGEAFTRVAV